MKTFCIQKNQFEITENQLSQATLVNFWNTRISKCIICFTTIVLLIFIVNILPAQTATAPTLGDGSASNPYRIASLNNLYWIAENSTRWSYHYVQTANIDASATSTWFSGLGWTPIGNSSSAFGGTYDGQLYTISNLYINRNTTDYIGLFGKVANSLSYSSNLTNIILTNVDITGNDNVGGLCGGTVQYAVIKACSCSGSITGNEKVGGIVGYNYSSDVKFSKTAASVKGSNKVGGFIGSSEENRFVENNYSRGNVTRTSGSTNTWIGGFIGQSNFGYIRRNYSTGSVTYESGISPTDKGFVGYAANGTYIHNSWDTESSGQATTGGAYASGRTTANMHYQGTFSEWDFIDETTYGTNDYWGISPSANDGYPFLEWEGFQHETIPTLSTQATTYITTTTATGNGTINFLGYPKPTQHGHCWGTTPNPTTTNSKTTKGSVTAIGDFTSALTGLTANTTYYIRAYATNTAGTGYGTQTTFTTAIDPEQTITFPEIPEKTYGDAVFYLEATASSGLTVTYTSSNTSVATVSGNRVTITGAGESTITAYQEGDETYNPATPVEQTLTVVQKNLTVSGATAADKAYDGTANATISGTTLVGKVGRDDVSITDSRSGIFDNENVGRDKRVSTTWTLTGTKAANYSLTQPTGLLADITAKALTVINAAVTAKEYDADTNVSITGATLSGVIKGETVTLGNNRVGTFSSKNVGTGKTVTTVMTISGTDATNYTLTQPSLTGNITAKGLTVTGAAAQNKVYNGYTTATISGAILSGVVSDDVVSLENATSGNFDDANVGNGKPVTTAMTLSGTDAGNYTLAQPAGLTANITPKGLTVVDAVASNKVYDGNTTATITGATLSGLAKGDVVSLDNSTTGQFDSANIGNRKPVTTTMTLSGADAGNYTLTQPKGLEANITAKNLTVSGAIAQSKFYDAGTSATISGSTLTGVVAGDDCTLLGGNRGTYSQATVGVDIPVSTSMTLRGDQSGNYTLTQPTGLMANILQKDLIVTADDIRKTHGTTYTFIGTEFTTSGLTGSDAVTNVTLTSNGAGAGAIIGNYLITISNATGSGLSNYSIDYIDGTMTVEDRTELTLTRLTANNKTYDGTSDATISSYGTLTGVDPTHTVSLVTTGATASSSDKNYGVDKTVTVYGLSLEGADAGLYFIGNPTTTASINKRQLTLSNFTAQNKVYDGTTSVLGVGFDDDRIPGDIVTIGYEVGFETKIIGTNKKVEYYNIGITGGADVNNYYLVQNTGEATANITPKTIYLNATVPDKVYDGNTTATINDAQMTGVCVGDDVTLENHTTGTFDSKNVGENINVQNGMFLSGTDAGNYNLSPLILTANINPKGLTITAKNIEKTEGDVYTFLGTEFTANDLVSGDQITTANFFCEGAGAGATAGNYDIIINGASGIGLGNYNIGYVDGTMTVSSGIPENYELPETNLGSGENECFNALNNLTVAGNGKTVLLQDGSSATFIAGNSIRFLPGFHAQSGSYADAHISTTDFCENQAAQGMLAVQPMPETEEKSQYIGTISRKKLDETRIIQIKAYPNPCQGHLTVELENYSGETEFILTNLLGEIVYRSFISNENISQHNLNHLRTGIYLSHFINGKERISKKLIIK